MAFIFTDIASNGSTLSEQDRKILLASPAITGVLLFSRNFQSLSQLKSLIADIKQLKTQQPLKIAVDYEGGRVQRFKTDGFTPLPPMATLGEFYQQDKAAALTFAKATGLLMASELTACGVDINFAPMLDVRQEALNNPVIGDRSFSSMPTCVTLLASALIDGMKMGGLASVGKHFPGHGGAKEDTHISVAFDNRSFAQLSQIDLMPFKELIKNNQLDAIMTSHVIYAGNPNNTAKTSKTPATFCQHWIHYLRETLNFKGTIYSDDLAMQGALQNGSYADNIRKAWQAGCDIAILCLHEKRDELYHTLLQFN